MKKAVIYLRKSIDIDSEKSIIRQRKEIEGYAKENDILIATEFIDEDSPGSILVEREGLMKMLDYVTDAKDVDYILLSAFDRISRDQHDFSWIITELKKVRKLKTKLHSISEENDYDDDPTQILMFQVRAYGAAQERAKIRERLRSGREQKKATGGYIGGSAPYGFERVYGAKKVIWSDDLTKKEVIAFIFEEKRKATSMTKIAKKLNEEGIPTTLNGRWTAKAVSRVVKFESLYQEHGLI